jgi:hypothetical protein
VKQVPKVYKVSQACKVFRVNRDHKGIPDIKATRETQEQGSKARQDFQAPLGCRGLRGPRVSPVQVSRGKQEYKDLQGWQVLPELQVLGVCRDCRAR